MMRKTINTKVLTVAIVSIVLLLCQLKVSNGEGFCMTMADTGEQTCLNIVDQKSDEIIPKGANALGKPREVEKACIDRHQQCIAFAKQGECQKTPGWMIVNCAKSCKMCHMRDARIRCNRERLGIDMNPIYQPGDMDVMFRNITRRFAHKYDITILSESPWVVTFDNFLSDSEMNALITTQPSFIRSTDTGSTNEYGETGRILSSGRTSQNSWCAGECENHPEVKKVYKKIEEVTGVPRKNYESFQVLKYEEGQKYRTHHDYGEGDKELACGPRILTFFLYLSDVPEGGETAFPSLDIAVKPKKGRALLWPSTLSADPEEQDVRTMHEARPVGPNGLKYAANAWLHLYDYMTPNLWGCTGTFDELD